MGDHMDIDEDLHSRQLAVYGRESMRRMATSNILIVGLRGLGVEIAKNVILAGVKAVTLHDTGAAELRDLAAQFYLTPADVGKPRAAACIAKLRELNSAVAVHDHAAPLSTAFVSQFQVVVFTDSTLEEAMAYDDFCRAQSPPIAFIRAEVRGLCASVFCDFGPGFTVFDTDGENPHTAIVASITSSHPALVHCVEEARLEFEDGESVVFTELKGMPELADGVPRKVKNVKKFSFELDGVDATSFGAYDGGGIVTQVKQPKTLDFKSLRERLVTPGEFLLSDFSKMERSPQLHAAFRALDAFRAAHGGALPRPGHAGDAAEVVALAVSANATAPAAIKLETLDEAMVAAFARGASGELSPLAAMFGGVVGQEVIKAISGKFSPLNQWFYFDSLECLPSPPPTEAQCAPTGSRYDGQVAVLGAPLQSTLAGLNVFLVGAGALGCEFIKGFALMGVSCGAGGTVTVTDDDTIEKSNLSRQFLFRDWNIGQPKSTVAAAAASAINPSLKLRALQNRVSPDTETVFDDAFWEGTHLVVNALDNVTARLYVDSRCVYFRRPLLESGTLGTKCNTQVVVPGMTENYGASRDPPEQQAPMCTLHSFPHTIDHCLTWARSEFEGLLDKTPSEANVYLSDRTAYATSARSSGDAQARESLEKVLECLVTDRCLTYADCVSWARLLFQDRFHNKVAQLTYTFPEDTLTSSGVRFWSPPKRFPTAVTFDAADAGHASYIQAAAHLRAEVYGIAIPPWAADAAAVARAAAAVVVAPFAPKAGVTIETDPAATAAKASAHADEATVIGDLLARLEAGTSTLPPGYRASPVVFEKDNDSNYHMALIAGLANMRARSYGIAEVDKLQAKLIAGRIIPAIATTTAMATGLVGLELYKVIQNLPMESYRNTFANLALPLFAMAEPIGAKAIKHGALAWSLWDRWSLEGDLTVREVLAYFTAKALTAYSISCGPSLIYNSIFPKHKERLDKKMSTLALEVAKLDLPPSRRHFDVVVACEDAEGEDIDVPLVSIYFRAAA